METKYIKIKSLKDLKKKAEKGEQLDCCIAVGILRSSKDIWYNKENEKPWEIFHSISGETEEYNDKELEEWTNIPQAIKNGNFYLRKQL